MKQSLLSISLLLSLFNAIAIEQPTTKNLLDETCSQANLSMVHELFYELPEETENPPASPVTREALLRTALQFATVCNMSLRNESAWLENTSPFTSQVSAFTPFVQKLIVTPGAHVLFFGDLHGNSHSLLRTLNHLKQQGIIDDNFHVIKPDTYLVFLGDYVDRGNYGIEVIYLLMRLRIANPQNVFLIRGNHEDFRMNDQYGFTDELIERSGCVPSDLKVIEGWYATMPLALFLGVKNGTHTDYIQCCHGGPELGFNAQELLACADTIQYQSIKILKRSDHVRNLPIALKNEVLKYIPEREIADHVPLSPTLPVTMGLMWTDLIEDPANYSSPVVAYNKGRGWVHGKELTHYWFKQQSGPQHTLHAIIRGHQHYGHMLEQLVINKGLVSLWNNTAYTVLSAPVAGKQFPYDAYTHLKTALKFNEWSIKPVVVNEILRYVFPTEKHSAFP